MKHASMAVFRLSVYMKKPVITQLLQIALTFRIQALSTALHHGKRAFFWHYIDTAKRRFIVETRNRYSLPPVECPAHAAPQSFRVLYYKERISVKFFHILTDGTGGMIFLKTLTAEYLRLQGIAVPCADGNFDIDADPSVAETSNDFPKAEPTEKTPVLWTSPPYR
jgi:hypothetical protein